MNNPKLYTVKEAAKIVGVSTNTLYKYLDEDRIHAARGSAIQGRFRIPESALEEFLGVKLSSLEPLPEITTHIPDATKDEAQIKLSPLTAAPIKSAHIPLKLARILLILSLIAVLVDLFISKSISFAGQLSRIFFLAVMILLSYQEGGFRRS